MNTNELEELEKYHIDMAKTLETHVVHHKQRAAFFRNRRKKLKEQIDINISNTKTAEIIQALKTK